MVNEIAQCFLTANICRFSRRIALNEIDIMTLQVREKNVDLERSM